MRAIWSTIIISCFSAAIAQPVSELERAIATWNDRYSEIAYCYGIEDMGSIDEQNREMIRNMLIDPANVWMLTGDVTRPEDLVLRSAADVPYLAQSESYEEWASRVSSLVDQATYWFVLTFGLPNGTCIKSVAIANDGQILYNSIFSEAFHVEGNGLLCFRVLGFNIFGMVVARAEAHVNAICNPITGCLITCAPFCDAWILAGVARKNCTTSVIGQCCKLDYDFEIRSGIWIRIFGLTLGIGSVYTASGSCVECCKCRAPAPTPVVRPYY